MSATPILGELGCCALTAKTVEGSTSARELSWPFLGQQGRKEVQGTGRGQTSAFRNGAFPLHPNPELKLRADLGCGVRSSCPRERASLMGRPRGSSACEVGGREHELLDLGCSGWVVTAVLCRLLGSEAELREPYPPLTALLYLREQGDCDFTNCSPHQIAWLALGHCCHRKHGQVPSHPNERKLHFLI